MLTTPGFAPGEVFWILTALAKDVVGVPLAVRNSGLAAVFTALKPEKIAVEMTNKSI